ncbi:aminotransferase class I/II-fold pyridoxal phosphate-dependent enzyme [Paenibacillus paridis]|uniref:aminotransferase class I/II-fold pyridoxal phosphate-dependent enzyme n=1 Tax=Paenibacillus paridis TaxID=2583376 RepID=UPI00111E002F|nr:aminotransferase class I/II-fold pyridoxal phosphate-dependent enzyme [Paenibacillus paridis]
MKPFYAPLFDALLKHAAKAPAGFHVPGHHNGQAMKLVLPINEQSEHPSEYFYKIMQLDVTELSTTDDLHHPEASIQEAQQLAAKTFGTDETFFLVGGSTSGNLALLLTLCEPDDIVIVQRNVHKSVLNGLRLSGAKAVFLSPRIDKNSGLATVPALEQVEAALALYPEAKAVFLSNPNYYGMGISLSRYVEAAHRYNVPILVDEAHGAHYGFHEAFPNSSLSEGVDAVVQSAHKTLPTLTMGALLHVQGNRIPLDSLRETLAMVQSSSPSFPILASIDISRAMMDTLGPMLFDQSLRSVSSFRNWLRNQETTLCEVYYDADTASMLQVDPLRVVLYDVSGQRSGFELQKLLEQYGCFAEMADSRYVVLVFGVQTSTQDVKKLQYAIKTISDSSHKTEKKPKDFQPLSMTNGFEWTSIQPVSFKKTAFKNKAIQRIPLQLTEGQLSAEMVTPYPPGIAILYPGEKITAAMIDYIQYLSEAGAKFQGAGDPSLATISIFAEKADLPT